MMSYLPMEFSLTRYRDLVGRFPFERWFVANMGIKDKIKIFRTRKPYNFLLECRITAIAGSSIWLSWVRILILK